VICLTVGSGLPGHIRPTVTAWAESCAPVRRKEAEMSSRWWFPFDGMEEMSFKRVPEGWVYRVPNPWLLGRSRYYLVSEKQKSEIAGHHRRMWLFLLLESP
jgi:hypothetical protein